MVTPLVSRLFKLERNVVSSNLHGSLPKGLKLSYLNLTDSAPGHTLVSGTLWDTPLVDSPSFTEESL